MPTEHVIKLVSKSVQVGGSSHPFMHFYHNYELKLGTINTANNVEDGWRQLEAETSLALGTLNCMRSPQGFRLKLMDFNKLIILLQLFNGSCDEERPWNCPELRLSCNKQIWH